MDDEIIVKLFFERNEDAISESRKKYGAYCRMIAERILNAPEDAEEVENDTYLKAWNAIPPARPEKLAPFLGMLCRQSALDRLKTKTRQKRGGGEYEAALDELAECVSDTKSSGDFTEGIALRDALNSFLATLPERTRIVFMRRYWWAGSIKEIAEDTGMSESNVKMLLHRTREKLREHLEKEGFEV